LKKGGEAGQGLAGGKRSGAGPSNCVFLLSAIIIS